MAPCKASTFEFCECTVKVVCPFFIQCQYFALSCNVNKLVQVKRNKTQQTYQYFLSWHSLNSLWKFQVKPPEIVTLMQKMGTSTWKEKKCNLSWETKWLILVDWCSGYWPDFWLRFGETSCALHTESTLVTTWVISNISNLKQFLWTFLLRLFCCHE